ncbi:Crp/Fnr family transcriptional regulator [Nitrospira moscoviensis]|uniref:Putative Transcriptional regulator, Crp/Fnr family n=1 Tax=Nitrospira moscoviensis TaxID=42253 RepID=A0A0K2GFE2_NITMO|nr:helix-turn-helix domain-containing protein [Nitrospira moscoviensis]ALA59671.1 putative Transcriptional regulator, Crp/Fnr family [Nitrospira moscoviensis]
MAPSLEQNKILAQLPESEKEALRGSLTPVSLQTKEEISYVGSPLRHIYFPLDAAISLMDMQPAGRTVEVAVIGSEGCSCSYVIDGLTESPSRIVVQMGGAALRLDAAALRASLARTPLLVRMIRRYNTVLFRHAVISVGCSQFHSVEQRLARWLLAQYHRTGSTTFPFTHEFIAEQLGSQRATVTETLVHCQATGLVQYGYGTVELRNISGLQAVACECFRLATQAIDDYLRDIRTYRA